MENCPVIKTVDDILKIDNIKTLKALAKTLGVSLEGCKTIDEIKGRLIEAFQSQQGPVRFYLLLCEKKYKFNQKTVSKWRLLKIVRTLPQTELLEFYIIPTVRLHKSRTLYYSILTCKILYLFFT